VVADKDLGADAVGEAIVVARLADEQLQL